MKKLFHSIFALSLLFSVQLFAAPKEEATSKEDDITFISSISGKNIVTVEDAVNFYCRLLDKRSGSFEDKVSFLKGKGLLSDGSLVKEDPARRGFVAQIIARDLKLSDSLMYLITGFDRYAYTECVSAKIMKEAESPYGKMSGEELIQILTAASDRKGE